jgi:uncharacterized membrane protein YgcG
LIKYFYIIFLLSCLAPIKNSFSHEIPALIPNVDDTTGVLSTPEKDLLNEKIQDLISKRIAAAAYVTNTLNGEAIEDVADKDVLFKSLAQYYRSNAIGVVLSGSKVGADGTEGVKAIKAAGGHIYA